MDQYCKPIVEEEIITNGSFMNSMGNATPFPNIEESGPLGLHYSQTNEPVKSGPATDRAHSVVMIMHELFPDSVNDLVPERFANLTAIIGNILENLSAVEAVGLKTRLKGHVGIYDDGYPWIDFEAAWLLNLHSDLWKPSIAQPLPMSPALSPKIKVALQEGRYVPMQHILHGLAIAQFNPNIEDYPLAFTQPIPFEFVGRIKRSDVIRGVGVHALFLGSKFPLLAARIPSVIDELWRFMLQKRFSAMAGMELYNEFFFDFSRQLGNGVVPSIDHIPPVIYDRVAAKYVPDLQIYST